MNGVGNVRRIVSLGLIGQTSQTSNGFKYLNNRRVQTHRVREKTIQEFVWKQNTHRTYTEIVSVCIVCSIFGYSFRFIWTISVKTTHQTSQLLFFLSLSLSSSHQISPIQRIIPQEKKCYCLLWQFWCVWKNKKKNLQRKRPMTPTSNFGVWIWRPRKTNFYLPWQTKQNKKNPRLTEILFVCVWMAISLFFLFLTWIY